MYETISIKSIDELIIYVEKMIADHNTRVWFRGHPDESYTLVPKVMRDPFRNYIECEDNFTSRFYQKSRLRMDQSIDREKRAYWLSIMQHYGLPTRLLDWSCSPLIAMYFALFEFEKYPKKDACIWAMRPRLLNEAQEGFEKIIYSLDNSKVKPLIEKAFNRHQEKGNRIVACWAVEKNLRMLIQQSAFTVHDSDTPIEELDIDNLLVKFTIPYKYKIKEKLHKHLEVCGFRMSDIYPEFDFVAEQIKQEYVKHIEY